MKLVEILARKLKAWPENATQIVQDDNGLIKYDGGDKTKMGSSGYVWIRSKTNGSLECDLLACDWKKAIVTRADWEAERAKLKAHKANADGWVRHRGGKCPVEAEARVDVRYRDGDIEMVKAGDMRWSHGLGGGDIMAYRIHKPAEQPAQVSEETIKTVEPCKFDAIAIRDRIRELDTQRAEVETIYQRKISEITQERESLMQKLAGEGLALVEVAVQPVEGMSDWRNWRAGDWVVGGGYSKPLKVSHVEDPKYDGKLSVYLDGIGWTDGARFTFYSRPAT